MYKISILLGEINRNSFVNASSEIVNPVSEGIVNATSNNLHLNR